MSKFVLLVAFRKSFFFALLLPENSICDLPPEQLLKFCNLSLVCECAVYNGIWLLSGVWVCVLSFECLYGCKEENLK